MIKYIKGFIHCIVLTFAFVGFASFLEEFRKTTKKPEQKIQPEGTYPFEDPSFKG